MKSYQQRKAEAETEAIEWQLNYCNHNYYWSEIAAFQDHFTRLAKRYGLVKVFKENGII